MSQSPCFCPAPARGTSRPPGEDNRCSRLQRGPGGLDQLQTGVGLDGVQLPTSWTLDCSVHGVEHVLRLGIGCLVDPDRKRKLMTLGEQPRCGSDESASDCEVLKDGSKVDRSVETLGVRVVDEVVEGGGVGLP